jgi:hypothetical protein
LGSAVRLRATRSAGLHPRSPTFRYAQVKEREDTHLNTLFAKILGLIFVSSLSLSFDSDFLKLNYRDWTCEYPVELLFSIQETFRNVSHIVYPETFVNYNTLLQQMAPDEFVIF